MNWEWKRGKKNFAAKHKKREGIIEDISISSRFELEIFCRSLEEITKPHISFNDWSLVHILDISCFLKASEYINCWSFTF